MVITDRQNAAQIFFDQAARPELRSRPRLMIPAGQGLFAEVTWGELDGRVQRLASFLMDRGVDQGVKVAVLSDTRLEWGLCGLALLAARGTLVPAYPQLTAELLGHVLSHSGAQVLFVETEAQLGRVLQVIDKTDLRTLITFGTPDLAALCHRAGLDQDRLEGRVFSLAQAEAEGARSLAGDPERVLQRTSQVTLDEVGYLIYTSGTTGLPKGVLLSHRNVGVNGAAWVEVNGPLLHDGDVDLLWLPMSHVFGWGEFCLGNQLGFLTYLSSPQEVLALLPTVRPHVFMSVPLFWEKLATAVGPGSDDARAQELRRLTGGRLRFCLSGGAGLRREVKEQFRAAGLLIIEGYGLTECSPTLTMNRHDDFDFSSVGKPFPGVRLKIAEDGEILAKGDNVFVGYHRDPQATADLFDEEGWLHTGDLGRFNERGFLQIVGRKKDILVTAGGKNIPPENIEMRFREDPLVAHVVVFGDGQKFLTAIVDIDESQAHKRLSQAGLGEAEAPRSHPLVREWVQESIDAVNAQLARYETIRRFAIADEPFTVESGLLTPSLKVRRTRVYEHYSRILADLYN